MVRKLLFIQSLHFVHFFYIWFLVGTLIFPCTSWWIEHFSINECNNFITLTIAWTGGRRCSRASSIFSRVGAWACFCSSHCCSHGGGCICSIYVAIWPNSWIFWWTFRQELTIRLEITDCTTTARNLFTFIIHEMSCRLNSIHEIFKLDQNHN